MPSITNVTYTEEQKKKVLDFWNSRKDNPPGLSDIVSHFSDGKVSDPRVNPEGYIVRKILLDSKIKAKNKQWEKVEEVILNDDQKEFIRNNIGKLNDKGQGNRPIDLTRGLFPELTIAPLGREVKAVTNYLKEIGEYVVRKDEGTMPEGRYEPPRTFHEILKKVNEYLHEDLTTQNINAYDKKCLETAIDFLHAPRFVQEINNYTTTEKRISFESEFIRAVYHKPDLTPEEISLTINACSDVLQAADLKKQLEKLNIILNDTAEKAEIDERAKLSMALSDTIGKVTTNLNEVLKRQERIYTILNKKRSDRKEENDNKVGSLTALFEWATEEKNRQKLIEKGKLQEHLRKTEIDRQETLDDLILLCLGMSKEEAVI